MERQHSQSWWFLAALGLLVVLSAFLRFSGLDNLSMTIDEATIVSFIDGVVERGYPYIFVANMEVPLATYELVPYFLALATELFGQSDAAARIPAAVFGVATTAVIGLFTGRWFGPLAGLLAAMIYALSPWAIYWAQNCFHPSQTQFFALLATLSAFALVRSHPVKPWVAVSFAVTFALTYLSWEGSGFLLPIFFIIAILYRWGQWYWFLNFYAWLSAAAIVLVVVAQGVRRLTLQEPYLMVGSGKGDMSLPQLVFTQTSYRPTYYLENFFGIEIHLVLTGFFLLGLLFLLRDVRLRFVYIFLATGIMAMTNLLAYYNAHYVYYLYPMFVVSVGAVVAKSLKLIWRAGLENGVITTLMSCLLIALVAFLAVAPSSQSGLKLYELLQSSREPMRYDFRPGLAGVDHRGVSVVLADLIQPNDLVIASSPLALKFYAGFGGDFFLQTITDRKVVYDANDDNPHYVDKFVGNPVLRSSEELADILHKNDRVWMIVSPYGAGTSIVSDEVLTFLESNMEVVFESYDAKLMLWSR